jgi:hypothetical protein
MFNSALLFLLLFLLFAWIIQHPKKGKRILYYALAVLATSAFIFIRTDHVYFINYVNILTGSQVALALVFFLRIFGLDSRYRLALLCGIAVMVISYMGSDTGLLKSATGWFITIPAILLVFDEIGDVSLHTDYGGGTRTMTMSSGSMKTYLVFVIILTSLMIRYVAVFGDEGSRHKMIHPVQIPLARGTFTTEEKAGHVEAIYHDLKPYVGEDDYLVGHGGGPLFIYLTGSRFYLYRTWILWYSTSSIVPDLREAYERNGRLPVILLVKEELFRRVYEEERPEIAKQRSEIYRFMDSYDYDPVVKKEDYEIWVPADNQ